MPLSEVCDTNTARIALSCIQYLKTEALQHSTMNKIIKVKPLTLIFI